LQKNFLCISISIKIFTEKTAQRFMITEILKIIILSVLAALSTYSFSKALWLLGVRGKEKSFKKLWFSVSCFFVSLVAGVGFFFLSIRI